MSQKKQLIYSLTALLTIPIVTLSGLVAFPSKPASAADCSDVFTGLSSGVINGVNENKSIYQEVSSATNVPWELLAAIHYRETGFSRYNPDNGQGVFQFVNKEGGPYPAGPVSAAEFKRQLTFMANKLQSDYVWRNGINPGAVNLRQLTKDETDISLIKNTLYSYNGRADVYKNQAANYNYSPNAQPFEGSPYVMNRFDCARARMGIITKDFGSLDGKDTRYGAFTVYARLKSDSYWLSLQKPYLYQTVSQEIYTDSIQTSVIPRSNDIYSMKPAARAYTKVTVRNIGNATWNGSLTRLGTTGPQDRNSRFADGWQCACRAARAQESSVPPGSIATFIFPIKAPSQAGQYTENFRVVLEGVTWITNSTTSIDIAVTSPFNPKDRSTNTTLKPGQQLTRGQNIVSYDRHSVLHMSFDGRLEIWTNHQRTWASPTYGSGADRVVNQADGNLVLYRGTTPVWASNTFSPGSNGDLIIQPDGNLVLYRGTTPVWASNSVTFDQTDLVNSVVASDQVIFPGQSLYTPDRYYRLSAQEDGNIVLYTPTRAIWASNTYMRKFNKLIVQSDGNLVAYDGNNHPTWSSRTNATGNSKLAVQADGNLVLYSSGRPLWSSNTFMVR